MKEDRNRRLDVGDPGKGDSSSQCDTDNEDEAASGEGNLPRSYVISFSKSGVTANWTTESHSILEFAESLGLQPDFSCRAGVCGTCCARITIGKVEYFEEPLNMPDDGELLICCSRPQSNVTIEL